MKRSSRSPAAPGSVRIVGGRWRGRRLPVADVPGLRPTGDRLRETLFNWLQGEVAGARCLDLFAGSGALGLEALSRGAAQLTLVEQAAPVARQLHANLAALDAQADAAVLHGDWRAALRGVSAPIDIAFVDPPFADDLLGAVIEALSPLMGAGGWVYTEDQGDRSLPVLPPGWSVYRERATRGAVARLLRVECADRPGEAC